MFARFCPGFRSTVPTALLAAFVLFCGPQPTKAQSAVSAAQAMAFNNVTWTTLGTNQNDSMPLGNGDLAANVWTEANGDLVLLLAKADAWTETGKLVKPGRVRIHTEPALFTGAGFSQTLHVNEATVMLEQGASSLRVWIDANHNALHIELHAAQPVRVHASLESWRTTHGMEEPSADKNGMNELGGDQMPIQFAADRVLPAKNSVRWFHWNEESIYPTVLHQQHLDALLGKHPDPLLHRCFGGMITGPGLKNESDQALVSAVPVKQARIDVVTASGRCQKPEEWKSLLDKTLAAGANPADLRAARAAHTAWWNQFWERSWIRVSGADDAQKVSQGYALQRYMIAAQSRGELPTKFNGGLFTVGGTVPAQRNSLNSPATAAKESSPDYRAWGNCYWNQNNRLLYWPLIATGDYDLLKPWFNMYLNALPLQLERARLYYNHGGASYPETMFFFGLPSMHDFGWNNSTNEIASRWQRYHIQGSLEVAAEMLDYVDATGDTEFAQHKLLPFADAIVTFYGLHWKHDAQGKILMYPTQSLETYQLDATNPAPDIAGLMAVLPRLLALPAGMATEAQRAAWTATLKALPELPRGTTAANGKTPPNGAGDAQGTPVLLPAEKYGKTSNSENPELYAAFPYHVYGVGKPDLKLAVDTYAARRSPQYTCWGQDGTQAAALGLTSEAKKAVVAEFTNYGDQRFKWFWQPAHDWIPDFDNGGSGMITLEEMLLQTDGQKILLLPTWPSEWTADFRLHAPHSTVVEGRVEHGKLVRLEVSPASRKQDVVVMSQSR